MSADIKAFIKPDGESDGVKKVRAVGGWYEIRRDGVYFTGFNKEGSPMEATRICSQLKVLGLTRNQQAQDWGRLLEWNDNDGNLHRWAMPMHLLAGDGVEVARELLKRGLVIAPTKSKKVLEYIQACESISRMTCTDKTGWHGGAFVLPDKVYGEDADKWIYQQDGATDLATGQLGSLEDWQANISSLARGNSRLVFAISAAFAGALVHPSGLESGGIHYYGGSTSGKTTSLISAASVWGAPSVYMRSWRATSNGLEGIASLHNDGTMFLDEMREISSKDASETAYMLGNGQGKTRSDRNGSARLTKSWRLLFLSSGEITLGDMLKSDGRRIYAGQEIRIADIPADAGAGMGSLEHLHQFESPAQLADNLRYVCSKYYGTAGAAWLEAITKDYRRLWDTLPQQITSFVETVAPNASGQAHRVALRFGLVAIAGELATLYGITGWTQGEATAAATRCFNDWLTNFGAGNREERQILETVKGFIERNGAKFVDLSFTHPLPVPDQVGYFRRNEDEREYLILASQFERVCEGFSKKQAVEVLRKKGWLNSPDPQGKAAISIRLPNIGKTRVYVVTLKED